jgi:MOSC domain-containing protein YiiM
MRLEAINIGRPREVDLGAGPESTAIFKATVDGPVRITADGLDGDAVGDTKRHGGPDQAAYVYFGADYVHWEALLNQPLAPGMFGDNLTITGVDGRGSTISSKDLWIGDRLTIGPVVLEVTSPRIPCGTFSRRMRLGATFIERFRSELRPGVYTRVVEPGSVSVGDSVELTEGQHTVSIVEMVELWGQNPTAETVERILAAPIARRSRMNYERKRAKA